VRRGNQHVRFREAGASNGLLLPDFQKQCSAAGLEESSMQHPDVTLIFVHALNAARNYLEERGTIPVFAYLLPAVEQDQLQRVVPNPSPGQAAQEVVEQLSTVLKEQARTEGYRAVAIITVERLEGSCKGTSTLVLQVAVDHSVVGPVLWHVPFRRVGERYEFGTRDGSGIGKQGDRFIFTE
jgi:hypothetical protein